MEKQINLTGGVIYNQDCLKGLKEIKDNQFDVAITSPPYNRVRNDKYAHYDDVKNNYYKMIVDVTIYHDKQIWAGCSFIGEYSTEEKALKVLDQIQYNMELFEHELTMVFQMPTDTEVDEV